MYQLVPVNNGVLDIDYRDMIEGIHTTATQALVHLVDSAVVRSTWTAKTQTDWDNAKAPTLSQAKASKIAELQQSYYASFTTFQSSATGVLKTYPIDSEAQSNFERLERRLIADANKSTFNFKTIEDGTLIAHTRAQFLQLLADAETFTVNQTTHYDSKVSSVNSAADVPTVQAITW